MELFDDVRDLNVEMLGGCNYQWHEVEGQAGTFDWSAMGRFHAVLEKSGSQLRFSCDFPGLFFHDSKDQLPEELRPLGLDDPRLLERYLALLDSYLEGYGSRTDYLVVHAEGAYTFFEKAPREFEPFLQLLSTVRTRIRENHPHIAFGVNTDPHNEDWLLEGLGQVVDFMAYDVAKIEGHLDQPSQLETLTKRLIRLANGKRIAFQNAGWSTSETEGSSEQLQVEFIQELFEVLQSYPTDFEYASFYSLYDEDLDFMRKVYRAMFPDYPEDFVEKMVRVLGRTGIERENGEKKPGYSELGRLIAAYRSSSG